MSKHVGFNGQRGNNAQNMSAEQRAVSERDQQKRRLALEWNELLKLKTYRIKQEIGKGSYGCVVEAEDKQQVIRDPETNQEGYQKVAIKKSNDIFNSTDDPELIDCKRMLREIAILSRVQNRNVVKLYDMYLFPDGTDRNGRDTKFNELYSVMELCEYDLKKMSRHPVNLQDVHVKTLFYRLCQGVHYLHSVGIWHRDLKPANILVNLDCSLKICDFGLARAVGMEHNKQKELSHVDTIMEPGEGEESSSKMERVLTGHVVTRWYRAPELILLHSQYNEAVDIWSIGCILYELLLMEKRYCENFKLRNPLFPGSCCFPLSPRSEDKRDEVSRGPKAIIAEQSQVVDANGRARVKTVNRASLDQLLVIFEIIGCPPPGEYDFLEQQDAKDYILNHFQDYKNGKGVQSKIKNLEKGALDLINDLLTFNPYKRVTLPKVLNHPWLSQVAQEEQLREQQEAEAKGVRYTGPLNYDQLEPIQLDFELEPKLDEATLRKHYRIEQKRVQQQRNERNMLAQGGSIGSGGSQQGSKGKAGSSQQVCNGNAMYDSPARQ